jgi:hypothetical protein
VSILKSKNNKFGIQLLPTFSITQDLDSINVLTEIQTYFNCGTITKHLQKNSAEFRVNSISDLQNIIIPHFKQYPLFSIKLQAFQIFITVIELISNKKHFIKDELLSIIKLIYFMNVVNNKNLNNFKKLSELLIDNYNEDEINSIFNQISYPLNDNDNLISSINIIKDTSSLFNDNFIIGFIDGDGSFNISFDTSKKISFEFSITQHHTSLKLLQDIKEFFGCGTIKFKTPTTIRYQVNSLKVTSFACDPFYG